MGRRLRPYSPGSFFHLIGRTQARIHWFDDAIKDRIVQIIADAVEASDVALNAFAVMENHFHLLVHQGAAPLSAFMQPVMRRTALLLKAQLQLENHVFGGRFWDRRCADAADLRTCIRYIHRNPVRAGCCADPGDYPWSSHVAYARVLEADCWRPRITVLRGIFAASCCASESQLCTEYERYVNDEGNPLCDSYPASSFWYGDRYASDLLAAARRSRAAVMPRKRADLRDIVQNGIDDLCPELGLEMVRTFRGAWISRLRRLLVQRAGRAGYTGVQIARYLHMSESQVSRIIRALPVFERHANRHVMS